MRILLAVTVLVIGLAPALPGQGQTPGAPKVRIAFDDVGRVTLIANQATLREILAEWTRVGGSIFVDAERLSNEPLTLEYQARPEAQVIASLLGRAAGFVIGPRHIDAPGASRVEVVYVLATSNPTQGAFTSPAAQQSFQQPAPTRGAPDDEIPPVGGGRAGVPPGPQQPPQQQAPPPGPQPTGTSGVAVPVTIVPVTTVPPPTTGRGGGGGGGR